MSLPARSPDIRGTSRLSAEVPGSKRELRQRSPGPPVCRGASDSTGLTRPGAQRPRRRDHHDRLPGAGRLAATAARWASTRAVRRSRHAATSSSTSRVCGDHGRAALQLPTDLDDPLVEVVELAAHLALGRDLVQPVVELGVLLAQGDRRWEEGDVLALDELLDPPVGVVLDAEVLDRLAPSGQVVELAALHRLAHLQVDPGRLLSDAGGGGGATGAVVARGLTAYGLGVRPSNPSSRSLSGMSPPYVRGPGKARSWPGWWRPARDRVDAWPSEVSPTGPPASSCTSPRCRAGGSGSRPATSCAGCPPPGRRSGRSCR